ncbi:MAG: Flp family type IVb pilin [Alphaproteobacteria bacterium]
MKAYISSFLADESAVTAMEYGMIASLTAVAIIVALGNLGIELNKTFTTITRAIADANAKAP